MNAVSVGFLPLEPPNPIHDLESNVTGWEFTAMELLETSAVSVPANSQALARCVEKGFDAADLSRVFTPAVTAAEVYRKAAETWHEVAAVSVSLARRVVRESLAALKAAGVRTESDGEMTWEELLAIVKSSKPEVGDETDGNGDITTLDQLADAIGTPDEEPSLEEVFSDSRSLRTGKFKFAVRPELK